MSPGSNGAGLSRKHVMWQIRGSLKRLQMDYVDIYYMHIHDPDMPCMGSQYGTRMEGTYSANNKRL